MDCIFNKETGACKNCGFNILILNLPITIKAECGIDHPKPFKPITTTGAGSYLHKVLSDWNIFPTGDCNCDSISELMNIKGPKWCREEINYLIDEMGKEAKKRNMLFFRKAGKALILQAIRLAERDLKNVTKTNNSTEFI